MLSFITERGECEVAMYLRILSSTSKGSSLKGTSLPGSLSLFWHFVQPGSMDLATESSFLLRRFSDSVLDFAVLAAVFIRFSKEHAPTLAVSSPFMLFYWEGEL
jgi:hypothetical protein